MMGGFVLGPILILGVVIVAAVVMGLMFSMARNRKRYETPIEQVSLDDQIYIRPLLRSRQRIEDLLLKHGDDPNVKVIGSEALTEIDALLDHTKEMLRSDLGAHRQDLNAQLAEARQGVDDLVGDLERTVTVERADDASKALRESLGRIQSLSASLDEAEQLTDRNL